MSCELTSKFYFFAAAKLILVKCGVTERYGMCSDSFWLDESELGAVIPQPQPMLVWVVTGASEALFLSAARHMGARVSSPAPGERVHRVVTVRAVTLRGVVASKPYA